MFSRKSVDRGRNMIKILIYYTFFLNTIEQKHLIFVEIIDNRTKQSLFNALLPVKKLINLVYSRRTLIKIYLTLQEDSAGRRYGATLLGAKLGADSLKLEI